MGRARFGFLTLACLAFCLGGPRSVVAADWAMLDPWQETVAREQFQKSLDDVYCPSGALTNYLEFTNSAVRVFSTTNHQGAPLYELQFGNGRRTHWVAPAFKTIHDVHQLHNPTNAPLRGLRIVLDPGHIGGEWARMEERFFQLNKHDRPVQEAVLNLRVARLLKPQLEAAGATVLLTKNDFQPVTSSRPDDFYVEARQTVMQNREFDSWPELDREAGIADAICKRQELLFYRSAEIAARARLVNEKLKPDLTVCIHFNAVDWNEHFDLVDDNRLVVFVHGNYLPNEVADDDQKLRLFRKVLEGSHTVELAAAESVAQALGEATKLPAVDYGKGPGAIRCGANPFVYARNLAANRLVDGPVIFLEPYYQNNRIVYQRIQQGDYEGTSEIEGHPYPSIFKEYADAVAKGLIGFYSL